MFEGFPGSVLMYPVINALIIRHIQTAKSFFTAKGGILGPKIRAAQKYGVHLVADHAENFRQVGQGNVALFFEHLVNVILAGEGGNIPFFNIANPFGVF